MNATETLRALIERVESTSVKEVRGDQVASWPDGCLEEFEKYGLLQKSDNATEVLCPGCDERCFVTPMPTHGIRDGIQAFGTYCEVDPGIGHVEIPAASLRQWRFSMSGLATAIATDFNCGQVKELIPGRLWDLGEARIDKRLRRIFFASGLERDDASAVVKYINNIFEHGSTVILSASRPSTEAPSEPGWVYDLVRRISTEGGRIHVDRTGLAPKVGRSKGKHAVIPIDLPPNTTWENITIRIRENPDGTDPDRAEIMIDGKTVFKDFKEMGMADNRAKYPQPAASWKHLVLLAKSGGQFNWGLSEASPEARAYFHQIRTALKETFGMKDDPFHSYKKTHGWKPRFNLVYIPSGF